jgi:GntR family transcriptional regulator / MocR family aminotransferase
VAKRQVEVPVWVSLDTSSVDPLHRQLYDRLRSGILAGQLSGGARLPSTRTLAAELGVSRTTVVTAFENLLAEGYLEGRVGSGTYVAGSLPEEVLGVRARPDGPRPPLSGRSLSRPGTLLATTRTTAVEDTGTPRAFRPGVPALDVRGGLMLGYAAVDEARTRDGVRRLARALE